MWAGEVWKDNYIAWISSISSLLNLEAASCLKWRSVSITERKTESAISGRKWIIGFCILDEEDTKGNLLTTKKVNLMCQFHSSSSCSGRLPVGALKAPPKGRTPQGVPHTLCRDSTSHLAGKHLEIPQKKVKDSRIFERRMCGLIRFLHLHLNQEHKSMDVSNRLVFSLLTSTLTTT